MLIFAETAAKGDLKCMVFAGMQPIDNGDGSFTKHLQETAAALGKCQYHFIQDRFILINHVKYKRKEGVNGTLEVGFTNFFTNGETQQSPHTALIPVAEEAIDKIKFFSGTNVFYNDSTYENILGSYSFTSYGNKRRAHICLFDENYKIITLYEIPIVESKCWENRISVYSSPKAIWVFSVDDHSLPIFAYPTKNYEITEIYLKDGIARKATLQSTFECSFSSLTLLPSSNGDMGVTGLYQDYDIEVGVDGFFTGKFVRQDSQLVITPWHLHPFTPEDLALMQDGEQPIQTSNGYFVNAVDMTPADSTSQYVLLLERHCHDDQLHIPYTGGILAKKLNPDGAIEWTTFLPKRQQVLNPQKIGSFMSYSYFAHNGTLSLIHTDHPDNEGSETMPYGYFFRVFYPDTYTEVGHCSIRTDLNLDGTFSRTTLLSTAAAATLNGLPSRSIMRRTDGHAYMLLVEYHSYHTALAATSHTVRLCKVPLATH